MRTCENSYCISSIFSEPHPASNLSHTKVTTGNVTLLWDQRESRPDYTYLVQVINGSQNIIRTEVVSETTVNITGLLSGSNFSFTVTTRAADGTAASPDTANFFTRMHHSSEVLHRNIKVNVCTMVTLSLVFFSAAYGSWFEC